MKGLILGVVLGAVAITFWRGYRDSQYQKGIGTMNLRPYKESFI